MSVITAIILIFYTVGFMYFLAQINTKFVKYDEMFAQTQKDIAELKTNIALLVQSTQNIEVIFEKHTETIEKIMENCGQHSSTRSKK